MSSAKHFKYILLSAEVFLYLKRTFFISFVSGNIYCENDCIISLLSYNIVVNGYVVKTFKEEF